MKAMQIGSEGRQVNGTASSALASPRRALQMPRMAGGATKAKISAEVEGNRLQLLSEGRERFEALLALIDGAVRDLRLLYYMFSQDKAGEAVRDALVRAAGRGVSIRLLIDGFGSDKVQPDFLAPLNEAGGHYYIFHARLGRRYLIRNHQKLAIADGQRALVGGANVDLHYLAEEGESSWRDLWLAVNGPTVGELAHYFDAIEGWTRRRNPKIRDLRRIITSHSRGKGKVTWKFSGPMRRHNPWPAQIVADICAAKRLDIVAAYFAPSNAMLRRIGSVVSRGGIARLVVAAKSDNSTTVAAARFTYARLLKRGVFIFEYQPEKLHTKLYITDDVVHLGSSNFDFRSLYLNLEMMIRIEDAAFAQAMREYIEGEVADSIEITAEFHKSRATLWRKAKWAVAHFLVTTMDYTVTRRVNFGLDDL
jgi:cardiolipin synthase